jgi:hypothetical protein
VPVDVLEDDDGVVDQHPDRERERHQRHRVEREVERVEEHEARHQGRRDRERGDRRRAEVAQEEQHDHGGERSAVGDVDGHVADRRGDEDRGVERDGHLVAGRQFGADPREFRLHRLRDLDGVLARLAADQQRDAALAVEPRNGALLRHPVLDGGHVVEVDGAALPLGDDQATELVGVGQLAERLERPLAAAGLEAPTGQLDVLALQRDDHVVDGESVATEAHRVDQTRISRGRSPAGVTLPTPGTRSSRVFTCLSANSESARIACGPEHHGENRRRVGSTRLTTGASASCGISLLTAAT